MRNRERFQEPEEPETTKNTEKRESFINALDRQLSIMEQSGEITPGQAEDKRQAARLIEVDFSDDPGHDAELFAFY